MSVSIVGMGDVIREMEALPSALDRQSVYEGVAEKFAPRLRAATPAGYSGRLRDSVIHAVSDDEASVGYERDVETAGNPALDSVIRPSTRGRSVLRWVAVDELASILEETFDAFSAEAVTSMADGLAEQINGGT